MTLIYYFSLYIITSTRTISEQLENKAKVRVVFETMIDYWTVFAYNDDSNSPGESYWLAYDPDGDGHLEIDSK